jgi:hypothetical protein
MASSSPGKSVGHVPSHNTQHMSSAWALPRHKNVFFLKRLHCFIPARWTNQRPAGGASRSTGQVVKKVAGGKGRVGTPAGHHPPYTKDHHTTRRDWKFTVKTVVFRHVKSFSLVDCYERFGATCQLRLVRHGSYTAPISYSEQEWKSIYNLYGMHPVVY